MLYTGIVHLPKERSPALAPGPYYLRPLEHCHSRASASERPTRAARGVVIECIDRARGHTRDIFAQTLPGTLSTTAKLTPFRHLTARGEHGSNPKRFTETASHELSLLYQLAHNVGQAGRTKTRTVEVIVACKRRSRTLTCESRAATHVVQQESRHAYLHGRSTSMQARRLMDWSVPHARASNTS